MLGIVAYGAYVPYWRLDRSRITDALGSGGGRGTRAVASYDEDATSMGVEASRAALATTAQRPSEVVFVSTTPPYQDKTNATAIHAALGLDSSVGAYDMVGSVRSHAGAVRRSAAGSLIAVSDVRTGLPGGSDETNGGDGAAAFLLGDQDVIAERIGFGSATAEFLDRWRVPGDPHSSQWEERFGEAAYVPLAEAALTDALKSAGLTMDQVDHFIVSGLHARAARRLKPTVDDLSAVIGNAGAAQAGILLADVLDRAEPGQVIVRAILSDGADVSVWRTTDAITDYQPKATVQSQIAGGRDDLRYADFLTWRGFLDREPPRRPDPERPAAPAAFRHEDWKYGFVGSRCECGARHLPPSRVCVKCHAVDKMTPERLADVPGTIVTYTVDRLAYSLSPPVVVGVIDFDGGGRFQSELTDVDPGSVRIGDRVEMTFRRLYTAAGVHNYFWKARPIKGER